MLYYIALRPLQLCPPCFKTDAEKFKNVPARSSHNNDSRSENVTWNESQEALSSYFIQEKTEKQFNISIGIPMERKFLMVKGSLIYLIKI